MFGDNILQNLYSVYTVEHNTLLIVKTHYTGDMFRLNSSHHQAYVRRYTLNKNSEVTQRYG
jgi:hypothetical protein